MFFDIEDEVQELFYEAQHCVDPENVGLAHGRIDARVYNSLNGFHFVHDSHGKSFRTPERAAYSKAYAILKRREDIRDRLLAGERPAPGKRGPAPRMWWEVAADLGIDLGPIPAKRTAAQRSAVRADVLVRRRILAGERPSFKGKTPSRWLRIAGELGIDLRAEAQKEAA